MNRRFRSTTLKRDPVIDASERSPVGVVIVDTAFAGMLTVGYKLSVSGGESTSAGDAWMAVGLEEKRSLTESS